MFSDSAPVDPPLRAFLGQVHRHVVRLGPRDHLAVERLLRQEGWTHGELRAALASVLARDAEQWTQIARLYDRFVAKGQKGKLPKDDQAMLLRPPRPPSLRHRVASEWRTQGRRWVHRLRSTPRSLWFVFLWFVFLWLGLLALAIF